MPIKPIKQIRSQAVDLKPTAFSAPFTLRTNAMRNTVNSLSSVHGLPVAQWGLRVNRCLYYIDYARFDIIAIDLILRLVNSCFETQILSENRLSVFLGG